MGSIPEEVEKVKEILCHKQNCCKAMFKKPGFDSVKMYECPHCHSMIDSEDMDEQEGGKKNG